MEKGARKFVPVYSNQHQLEVLKAEIDPWYFPPIRIAKPTSKLESKKPNRYGSQSSQQDPVRPMAAYDENVPPPSTQPRHRLRHGVPSSPDAHVAGGGSSVKQSTLIDK
ncbi:hypothetical protein BDN70DRAFT_940202, partial [Pholiota conissans]